MAVGTVLAAVAIGAKLFGFAKKRKAAKRQQAAINLRRRITAIQNARGRKEAIRQANAVRAGVIAAGANSGASLQSSSVQGAEQSVFSQLEGNLNYASDVTGLSQQAGDLDAKAANSLSQASLFDTIGNISGTFADAMGGFSSLGESVFNPQKQTTASTKPLKDHPI